MHHFKAKGGTHFNFNSDMSGNVHTLFRGESGSVESSISGADMLEFARWYAAEYGEGDAGAVSIAREQINGLVSHIDRLVRERDDAITVAEAAVKSGQALLALLEPKP